MLLQLLPNQRIVCRQSVNYLTLNGISTISTGYILECLKARSRMGEKSYSAKDRLPHYTDSHVCELCGCLMEIGKNEEEDVAVENLL